MRSEAQIRKLRGDLAVILAAKCSCKPGTMPHVQCAASSMALDAQREILGWVVSPGPDLVGPEAAKKADYIRSGHHDKDLANPKDRVLDILEGLAADWKRAAARPPEAPPQPKMGGDSDPGSPDFRGRPTATPGLFHMPPETMFAGDVVKVRGTVMGYGAPLADGEPVVAIQFVLKDGNTPVYAMPVGSIDLLLESFRQLKEQATAVGK